jgi:hypothetical protein
MRARAGSQLVVKNQLEQLAATQPARTGLAASLAAISTAPGLLSVGFFCDPLTDQKSFWKKEENQFELHSAVLFLQLCGVVLQVSLLKLQVSFSGVQLLFSAFQLS